MYACMNRSGQLRTRHKHFYGSCRRLWTSFLTSPVLFLVALKKVVVELCLDYTIT